MEKNEGQETIKEETKPAATGHPAETKTEPKTEIHTQDAKKYLTQDDLANFEKKFDKGLEEFAREREAIRRQVEPPKVESPETEIAKKIADLWWTDPTEAMRLQKAEIKKEMDVEKSKERTQQNFWEKFYEENPTLRQHKGVVNYIMNENYSELKGLEMPNAQKVLSEKSLSFIRKVAESTGGKVETLTSDSPGALRASGETIPKPKQEEAKVVSFLDQVRKLQSNK